MDPTYHLEREQRLGEELAQQAPRGEFGSLLLLRRGQEPGTIGIEMLDVNPNLETLVIPIGGGGLISGIATAAKAIKPDLTIIGVEVEGYASAYNQFYQKDESLGGSTIAEGIAVKEPGTTTMTIIKELVDDIVLVDEEAIEEAINQLITCLTDFLPGGDAVVLQNVSNVDGIRRRPRLAGVADVLSHALQNGAEII